jgi:AbiV family abortive infection protein
VDDFHKTADYIADGILKTVRNAFLLCQEAKVLLDSGSAARGLSLSVLAIEEVGKAFLIDGLIFSTATDERARSFHEGFSKHKDKLEAAAVFPLAIPYFVRFGAADKDPDVLSQTCAIILHNWSEEKNELMRLFGEDCRSTQWIVNFSKLNKYKQAGFYVDNPDPVSFAAPQAIPTDISAAVYKVAWRMAEALHFILGQNTAAYREWIQAVRTKLSPAEAKELRVAVKNAMDDRFEEAYKYFSGQSKKTIH